MMEYSLLEDLSIADSERIHSQMIAWIFSDKCEAFDSAAKSRMICKLFKLEASHFDSFCSWTEFFRMDIVVKAGQELFVIENKLKTTQHSDQLSRYRNDINENSDLLGSVSQFHFGFLTLIGEDGSEDDWTNITYSQFLKVLDEELSDLEARDGDVIKKRNMEFLFDYQAFLRNLDGVLTKFNSDHRLFPNVFSDGSLKKYEKLNKADLNRYTDEQVFIAKNNLETILQTLFFSKVASRSGLRNPKITETRGNALVESRFNRIFEIEGRPFVCSIQIQGNTIKYAFAAENYSESERSWLSESAEYFWANEVKNRLVYDRFSPARSKTFQSVSKRFDNDIAEMAIDQVIAQVEREYRIQRDYTESIEIDNLR